MDKDENMSPTCKVIKQSENNFSILKYDTPFNISIILNEKSIKITMIRQLDLNNYEGIFTYDDFTRMSKFFFYYDSLEEIYKTILSKFNKQEVLLTEEIDSIAIKLEFSIYDKKNYEVVLRILKNPELNIRLILDNQSRAILQLSDKLDKKMLKIDQQMETLESLLNEKVDKLDLVSIENLSLLNTSTIMKLEEIEMVKAWLNFDAKFRLLYKSSQHGKRAKDFHRECDNKGLTITFIETTDGFRFGGYTTHNWDCSGKYKTNDPHAFLFSLDKKRKLSCNNQEKVIYCSFTYGPYFGEGSDIIIADNFTNSSSQLSSYGKFEGVGEYYLTGKKELSIKEVEVYSV